jgi:hypothetical protein
MTATARRSNTAATTTGGRDLPVHHRRGHGDAQHVGELIPGRGSRVHGLRGGGGYSSTSGTPAKLRLSPGRRRQRARRRRDIFRGAPAEFGAHLQQPHVLRRRLEVRSEPSSQNFHIYWTRTRAAQLQDARRAQVRGGSLLSASGCSGTCWNNGKEHPGLVADLLGDWPRSWWSASRTTPPCACTRQGRDGAAIYTLMTTDLPPAGDLGESSTTTPAHRLPHRLGDGGRRSRTFHVR